MKKTPKPEQVHIGVYRLGASNVDVFGVTNNDGGWFFFAPNETALPRIKIGFAYDHWSQVVTVLCHESLEFLMAQRNVRFAPDDNIPGTDKFLFVMDHNQFTAVCAYQGQFLAQCLPDLATAWKKWKPK